MNSNLTLKIENIGGIRELETSIEPGTTILSGENATNRSSFLSALQAILGYEDQASIRTGADHGEIVLKLDDGTTYTKQVENQNGTEVWSGDSYSPSTELIEIFCSLTRNNPLRQGIANGEDLYDLVMSPVDSDQIESEINDLIEEREDIKNRINAIEDKKREIEELDQNTEDKSEEVTELKAELSDVQDDINDIDQQDIESNLLERTRELNDTLKELNTEKEQLRQDIEQIDERIEARREELTEFKSGEEADVDELQERIDNIKDELSSKQTKIDDLKSDKRTLNPLQQFLNQIDNNDDIAIEDISATISRHTNEADSDLFSQDTTSDSNKGSVTDLLLPTDENADTRYKQLLDAVNTAVSNIRSEINDIEDKSDQLRKEKRQLNEKISQHKKAQKRMNELETEIESLSEDKESAQASLSDIQDEIDEVKSESDSIEDQVINETESKINELRELEQKETQLEIDIDQIQSDIERTNQKISEKRDEIDQLQDLKENKLPEIKSEINSLRERITEIEQAVVSEFNNSMEVIVDELGYNDIKRIWLEKRETDKRKGRRKIKRSVFDLHIGREVDGKITNETINNLSESESVIVWIILAIAGYTTHDINEEIPFILMDSIEMVDADRLESLLDYIESQTDYLIATALPEDVTVMDIDSSIDFATA